MNRRGSSSEVRVVHEDRDLIVVDKPAGLLTIGTDRERRRTLQAMLGAHVRARRPGDRVFVVHRLDREASGLLVFARTPQAKQALQEQFRSRDAGRTYLAVVEGELEGERRTFRSYLAENAALNVYSTRDASRGRLAVTHLRVLRRVAHGTLVEVRLETGRKHQIRVHLAEAGHPILGDRRYGPRQPDWRRLALHAAGLRFRHPRSGETLEFRSDPPPGFPPLRAARGGRANLEGDAAGRAPDEEPTTRARGHDGKPRLHEQGQERNPRDAGRATPGGRTRRARAPVAARPRSTGQAPTTGSGARHGKRRRRPPRSG